MTRTMVPTSNLFSLLFHSIDHLITRQNLCHMTLLGMSGFKGSALDIFSELLKAFEFYWQMVGDNVGRVPQMYTQLQVEISWKIRQMPFFVVCPFLLTICTKGKKSLKVIWLTFPKDAAKRLGGNKVWLYLLPCGISTSRTCKNNILLHCHVLNGGTRVPKRVMLEEKMSRRGER